MSHQDLVNYLRETETTLQPTDVIQIVPFEHGIKALFYHKDSLKPFKTRVYLKNPDGSEPMK